MSAVEPLPQVRRPEFEADTDLPAFDDDYLLSLGLTFRLRRGLGLAYAEAAAEYEAEMEMKAATDAATNVGFRLGGNNTDPGVLPLGGERWLLS